jgi:predicted DNA-binding transcriptional regulator AlpA
MPRPQNAIATVTPERMISMDALADMLDVSRRTVERMRSAGKIPNPDVHAGKMPRWKPETIRRWIDKQAGLN